MMQDKDLQKNLLAKLDELRAKVDWIGEKEIRQAIDQRLAEVHYLLKDGDLKQYKKLQAEIKAMRPK